MENIMKLFKEKNNKKKSASFILEPYLTGTWLQGHAMI